MSRSAGPSSDKPTERAWSDLELLSAAQVGERSGDCIGPYTLLEPLGEGGFGVVWLAERREPMVQRVALKIIKLGMDTRQVIARFEAERQALAVMDHPGIARVLDAGATPNGRPYFVMELVRGERITTYCDRNKLGLADRMELFAKVCLAVQHAHQKGIIHRDIKPGNVLVTEADGTVIPKVIDFGIAKATAARLTEMTLFTERGQLIGTPEYMSPEQAEMSAADIDTRSDIYSLGVLLYELLTGSLPFEARRLRSAAYAEIQRIIREEEPPKPSTRLSSLDSLPTVAASRRVDARRLAPLVRGDLDWIVMKCLEKDRARRYDTASGLAQDVQRHLAGEPVLAAPPSAVYRLRKFVRRNRGVVGATGVVLAALVLGTVGIGFALVSAERRRTQAQQSAEEAQRQSEIAAESIQFLRAVFEQAHAEATRGSSPTVREALDVAIRRIEDTQWVEPRVEAGIRTSIAGVLQSVGDTAAAANQARRAIAIFEAMETRSLDEAEALAVLANVISVDDDDKRPIELYQKSLAILELMEKSGEANRLAVKSWASVRCNLGVAMYQAAGFGQTDPIRRAQGLAILHLQETANQARALGVAADCQAAIDATLGQVLSATGRDHEAEPILRRMIAELLRENPWHPINATTHRALAELLDRRDLPFEAEPLYCKAMEIQRRTLSAKSPDLADTLDGYGRFLLKRGRAADAVAPLEEAVRIKESGGREFVIAGALFNVGKAYHGVGKLEQAEAALRRSDELSPRVPTRDWPRAEIRMRLAAVLIDRSLFAEAETILSDLRESPLHAKEAGEQLERLTTARNKGGERR